jgi:hypothetical protein
MTRATEPAESPGAAVRLAARLPKNNANGLRDWANLLVHEPRELRYAVIAFDVARVIDDLDSGTDTAVVRLLRIEPLTGHPVHQARELLEDAALARLGEDGQLDFVEHRDG